MRSQIDEARRKVSPLAVLLGSPEAAGSAGGGARQGPRRTRAEAGSGSKQPRSSWRGGGGRPDFRQAGNSPTGSQAMTDAVEYLRGKLWQPRPGVTINHASAAIGFRQDVRTMASISARSTAGLIETGQPPTG